ncbi:MAG: hypothetical protein LBT39_09815 [Treponema sp.]|nr:hypothetical protein [Treponema sp.]
MAEKKKGRRFDKYIPEKMLFDLGADDAGDPDSDIVSASPVPGRTPVRTPVRPASPVPGGLLAAAETARTHNPGKGQRKAETGRATGTAPQGRGLRLLTRILAAIAVALALIILMGTLYALFREPAPVSNGSAPNAGGETTGVPPTAVFTGIGRQRIAVSVRSGGGGSVPNAVVVLSVVFPYPPADRSFTEELTGKVPLFRRITRDYFGSFSPDELNPLDEDKAKGELLRRFNNELQLGKIEVLFFNDLMVLE